MAMATKTFIFLIFTIIPFSALSQSSTNINELAPSPESNSCNGIFISYIYTSGSKLKPTEPKKQPYRFESTLTVLNNGAEDLKSWQVYVGFQHSEILVSASNALLSDGSSLPVSVENGTVFAGYPVTDLKTAIETAGDLKQMSVQVEILGTQFGVKSPAIPLPENITLANDGFKCSAAKQIGASQLELCCIKDETFKTSITTDDEFLPRQNGDLTIMYDVTKTSDSMYWAQVTIENHNPLGRLDYWQLSWDWMQEEFINAMKGAYPSVIDSSDCVFGSQGTYYTTLDFANVLNCERRPTIVDLPLTMTNNSDLGMIKGCCRNGTILPKSMDPSKTSSVFQIQVFKMPPNLNRSELSPPQNFKISGVLNPDYKCGPPVRVSPSQFSNPNGLPSNLTSFASWQVVCNITQTKGASPKCCVSFSAYFNESVVPCKTCACGCSSNTSRTCSTTSQAILLPSEALLVPFENRTALTRAWADLKHLSVPNPMPCGDNCGVSINWHLYTDYSRGWTARITIFNWDDTPFADWFTAVQMDKAIPGFDKAYSFNATAMNTLDSGENNTIFMQGLEGLNYIVAESDGANPKKDSRVPGKQQSVISFTKKLTPGINVAAGDGFPTKLFFNGEECSLPLILPTNGGNSKGSTTRLLSVLLAISVSVLLLR